MRTRISDKDLFVPVVNRDMIRSYPELARIEEFKKMRSLDMKFCWYYAIFFSDEKNPDKRVRSALKHSWREGMDGKLLEKFLKLDFPDSIRKGITRFGSFDIGSRIRAKFAAERILDGFEKLAQTDVNTVGVIYIYADGSQDGEGEPLGEKRDWNQVSAFVNSMVKINESLPDLLKRVEEGFGVRSSSSPEGLGEGIRDDFQKIKEEQSTLI